MSEIAFGNGSVSRLVRFRTVTDPVPDAVAAPSPTYQPIVSRRNKNEEWKPSDEDRHIVTMMAVNGIPHEIIGRVFEVSVKTLRKHMHIELETGREAANAKVAQWLFSGICGTPDQILKNDNARVHAAMFWLKCRAGWKETSVQEVVRPISEMSEDELDARIAMIGAGENVVGFPQR
jgi:hypothetical protein